MRALRSKLFLTLYVSLLVGIGMIWYANEYIFNRAARAVQDPINVTFAPSADTFTAATPHDIDIIFQTPDAAKKVSGLDLVFTADGPIRFTNITDPVPFPGTDTTLFTTVNKSVSDSSIRASFVSLRPDVDLPSVLKIKLTVVGTNPGTAHVRLDTTTSQIVGNIAGKVYSFGTVNEGTYNITQSAVPSASLKFDPASASFATGETAEIAIGISDVTNQQGVSGFHIAFSYDPNLIDVLSLSEPIDAATGTDSAKFTKISSSIDKVSGKVDLTYVSPLAENLLPLRPRLSMKIQGKNPGTGVFRFETYEITGNVPGNLYAVNVFNGSINVSGQSAPQCTSNDQCGPTEFCNPSGVCKPVLCSNSIGPGCFAQVINNHVCELHPVPDGTACGNGLQCQAGLCVPPAPTATPIPIPECTSNAQCRADQVCNRERCVNLPCGSVATECLRVIARNHSCQVEEAADGTACTNGTCQAGACIPKVLPPTATPTPAGTVELQMKIKLQGILRTPSDARSIPVKVTVVGNGRSGQVVRTVMFTVGADGIWTGKTFVDVPSAYGYKVFVKPPQHLQKRMCEANPTETAAGTYRCGDIGTITLRDGVNYLDFSKITLLTGDLPDQDGIVDSYDLAYMRLNFGSTNPDVLEIADLNQDGIVDTQDYALVVASLSVKYDEI